jgi:aldehyde:ferredoxin oxidoreductase
MENHSPGYYGVMLAIDLTKREIKKRIIPKEYFEQYIGGRGLGIKLLLDQLSKPGIDPLSPENPLLFLTSPLSGYPVPTVSLACIVTKSPHTSPSTSDYPYASTITYSNMGGFFGPEIKFAGYDVIMITGKASSPVYIVIHDDEVKICDAYKFWGMGTDEFDRAFIDELGDRRFRTCYIGPAGENLIEYACIISTASRASGRGGAGCVMGSKNLKALAVKGSRLPEVYDHKRFLELLDELRKAFKDSKEFLKTMTEQYGTSISLSASSVQGLQTVKNFREGTFEKFLNIGAFAAKKKVWVRNNSCYCCPLACKKSGVVRDGPYAGLSHDGPEYETGTMLGANLMISDLNGLVREISAGDNYGLDIISSGNVIGFLMEAYDKGHISIDFLDGIDLKWGNVESALKLLSKIAAHDGIGERSAKGVKSLSKEIGHDSEEYAMHVKGLELAGWNVQANPGVGLCYATANRGGCHLNGNTVHRQNEKAMLDSLCLCSFGDCIKKNELFYGILSAVTGVKRTEEELMLTGERVFNLEKMFNYREGFRRIDDNLPERFFKDPFTIGTKKGAVLDRIEFIEMLDNYYLERGWDINTSKPSDAKLKNLGLDFTLTL